MCICIFVSTGICIFDFLHINIYTCILDMVALYFLFFKGKKDTLLLFSASAGVDTKTVDFFSWFVFSWFVNS
jgi:hypothetical protein